MKSWTVKTRLLAGFLTVALLGALVAGIGVYNMAQMNDQAKSAYQNDLKGISHSKEANINLIYIGRAIRGVMLATDAQQKQEFVEQLGKARTKLHAQLALARPLFVTPGGKALFAELDRAVTEYEGPLAS